MKAPQSSSLIICGVIKDAAKQLKKNILTINRIKDSFQECHVVIYENDSKDSTKEILKEWESKDREHIHCIIQNRPEEYLPRINSVISANPFFCKSRIEKMANLRNHYFEYIERENLEADYLMIVDLDVSSISYDGVMSSFHSKYDWDAVTAFGYSYSPLARRRYHDTYALVEYGEESIPQNEKKIYSNRLKYGRITPDTEWVRVYSAFGGMAIYRFDKVRNLRYKFIPNDNDRVESRCEHFSIYKGMNENDEVKVFINPQMLIKYQSVSFALICRTIKREILVKWGRIQQILNS